MCLSRTDGWTRPTMMTTSERGCITQHQQHRPTAPNRQEGLTIFPYVCGWMCLLCMYYMCSTRQAFANIELFFYSFVCKNMHRLSSDNSRLREREVWFRVRVTNERWNAVIAMWRYFSLAYCFSLCASFRRFATEWGDKLLHFQEKFFTTWRGLNAGAMCFWIWIG